MRRKDRIALLAVLMMIVCMYNVLRAECTVNVRAQSKNRVEERICEGICACGIDLAGMTEEEARMAVNDYIDRISCSVVTLYVSEDRPDEQKTQIAAKDLGLRWTNPECIEEAVAYGKKGNIFKRYREMTDLARGGRVMEISLDFDKAAIEQFVTAQSLLADTQAQNAQIHRENGQFIVVDGKTGIQTDIQASVENIYRILTQEWTGESLMIKPEMTLTQPEHDAQQLRVIHDLLGSCTTSFASSGSARSANVCNAGRMVDGTVLYPGEEFSTLATITPFTEENGYFPAGSYYGGKVVDTIGGGICQVSTTLYDAVLYSELEVTQRANHAMAVSYVKPGLDATVSGSSGIDFSFKNNTEYPIYIEVVTTPDKQITVSIYGVETRSASHEVVYESVVLEKIAPGPEEVHADESKPVGYVDVQPSHTGYVADVYRIVREGGVEVSREKISHNKYKMTVRSATVGVLTNDPAAYELIQEAVSAGGVDHAKAVAAKIAAGDY